jgi:hypothetical protein
LTRPLDGAFVGLVDGVNVGLEGDFPDGLFVTDGFPKTTSNMSSSDILLESALVQKFDNIKKLTELTLSTFICLIGQLLFL